MAFNGHAQPPHGKRQRRGIETTLPPTWEPRAEEYAYGEQRGLSRVDVITEADRFTNNAREKDRRCVNWDAAFRNWLLKAVEFKNQRKRGGGPVVPDRGALP